MSKFRPATHYLILLMLCTSVDHAAAQFTPAWTWNRHDIFVSTSGAVTTTRGIEFTVSEPIEVTALGAFDEEIGSFGPGLLAQHEMALWDVANTTTPLATATVAAASGSNLCQDGYRYASIAPITLVPGKNYVVAVYWPGAPFDWYPDCQSSGATVTDDPRITRVQERFNLFGNPFQFPATGQGQPVSKSYLGMMNFRIGAGACEPNPPADLTTNFKSNNGQAGNMFDLKALNPAGLTVSSWQINLNDEVTNATPVDVSIYWREGSYIGHESSAAGWNLLGTASVLSWGKNRPTPVPVGGLSAPAGQTIGVFITTKFETGKPPPASPPHLNYVDHPLGSNPTFQNADLLISGGVGKANPLFTGTTFAEKVKAFSGGVLYRAGPACAGDIDGDGKTCQGDLGALLATFGLCEGDAGYNAAANLSQSTTCPAQPGKQVIDQSDLGALLADYGCGGCP